MRYTRLYSLLFSLSCCLILLLTACGSGGLAGNSNTATLTPGSTKATTSQSGGTTPTIPTATAQKTQNVPPTQTSCPNNTAGVGRAAVMRPLALGSDPAIAYIFNSGLPDNPMFAELKWYDVVKGNKTVITHLSNDYITEAQVSSDGQWILFVTDYPQYDALQLVRMDGQGLQTLYCTTRRALQYVQWSPDQSQVIFSVVAISGLYDVYLLNMASGQVQPELVQLNNANTGYAPRTWADNAHVYLAGIPQHQQGPTILHGLYMLNTSKGPNQTPGDLQTVLPPASTQGCWDFDSDYHTTTLVTSSCNGSFSYNDIRGGTLQGPSSLVRQQITGGQQHTMYQNSTAAITQVRFLGYSSSSLLFTINSGSRGSYGSPIVDSSHNGVWKMNIDGSGLTELASVSPQNQYLCELNLYSQYPWANVSRNDGALYAVQASNLGNGTTPPTYLEYGSTSGGKLKSFAYANDLSGSLAIAGWTTM